MVGRYPYVEPSRCPKREVGEAQMRDLLERGGVRKFVCLQAELPPQEQMPVGGVRGFLPYRPTATLIAAALSGPPSLEVRASGTRTWTPSCLRGGRRTGTPRTPTT